MTDDRLAAYRRSIDNFDAALIHILAERFRITKAVGEYKATHELPPADPAREREQIQRLRTLAEESHLDPEFAEKWFNFVVAEVIHHHIEAAGQRGGPGEQGQGASSSRSASNDSGALGSAAPADSSARATR